VAAHDDEGLATAIQGRASLLAVMGSTAEAQDALEHALSLRIALNDVRGQGMTRANFAFMHALSGRFDEARSHLRAAVDLLARVGDVPGAAALNIAGALIEMVAGDLAECDRRLKAVYTSLPDPGGYCGLTWLRLTWTRVVLRLGRPEEARQHWEIAREMIERLGSVRPRIMLDELAKELQSSPA
jgi:tetratricopeptide (TPR) repeat protein